MVDLVSLALTHLRHEDAFVGDAVDPEVARFAPQYLGIGLGPCSSSLPRHASRRPRR